MFDKTNAPITKVEDQLIELMKVADEYAWAEVVERCSRKLDDDIIVSLQKRRLSPDFADDIQQQTWLTVVENINSFVPIADHSFYCWLRTISLNHIRNLARKRRPSMTLESLEEQSEYNGIMLDAYLFRNRIFADGPEKTVSLNEQVATLSRILDGLKPRDRDIILRRFLWGQSPKEISVTFQSLKSRSISQLLNRLLKSIRVQYQIIQGPEKTI